MTGCMRTRVGQISGVKLNSGIRSWPGALCVAGLLFGICAAGAAEEARVEAPAITHADAREAAKLVAEKKPAVLDIRTPREFAAGRIPGAVNIDFNAANFTRQLEKLDKDKPYLLHCATGRRSTRALPQFEKLGFKRIIHLDGGIKAWEKAGHATTK